MARIDPTRDKGRTKEILDRLVNWRGRVMRWRDVIAALPDMPEKQVTTGLIDYDRRRFNSLDHEGQRGYMRRLGERRHYFVEGIEVPKSIFDAVIGTTMQKEA